MKWLKRLLVGLFAIVILAVATAYLTPLDTYVPKVEQTLAEVLQEPVYIQHIRLAALPLPHLELQGVRLGELEGIAARSVKVEPDLPSLLAGKVVVRRILVSDGTASFVLLRKLMDAFSKAPGTEQKMAVRELQFSKMNLLMPDMTLELIDGKLEFTQAGSLKRAWLAMNEQKATAVLLPLPEQHFSVTLHARTWTPPKFPQLLLDELQVDGVLSKQDFVAQKFVIALHGIRASGSGKVDFSDGWYVTAALTRAEAPLERVMALLEKPVDLTGNASAEGVLNGKATTLSGLKDSIGFSGEVLISPAAARIAEGLRHPLIFDRIKAHVVVQPERIELSALEAKLYGGKLSGTVSVNRKKALLTADVVASGVDMRPLVEALTNEVLFTGSMESAARFSMQLDTFERFPENMLLTGDFHLRNGVLTKVDLAQAVSNPDKASAKGGKTRFDDLTGLIGVDANGYHFRKIKIASGSLNAEGNADVSPSLQLRGQLDVKVKGTAGLVSMPVVVSGTLDAPVVSVSKAAWAGAAVGTAILGPGLGTALGIKVGGFLKKLFGMNDNKNNDTDNTRGLPENPPAKK
ncbi:MAG TPA: AsmA-like C-terminal region-containing protein [Gallionella sp.]|nr:AsmA-like C-terminal region-containing protein [Gallionella sp.]